MKTPVLPTNNLQQALTSESEMNTTTLLPPAMMQQRLCTIYQGVRYKTTRRTNEALPTGDNIPFRRNDISTSSNAAL